MPEVNNIEDFALSSKGIYAILNEKGVKYLHHANTVSTSFTFIEKKALLSRAYIEQNDLFQTSQKSDDDDKAHDVWGHVFLDGEDLHERYSRANKYGPILFRINIELLNNPAFQTVFVTKSNPWYWKESTKLEDKFYSKIEDVNDDYLTGKRLDSQIMFTIREPDQSLKLNKFLDSIVIDKPKLIIKTTKGEEMSVGDFVETVLREKLIANGLGHIPIIIRHEGKFNYCGCHFDYNRLSLADRPEFGKRFSNKRN